MPSSSSCSCSTGLGASNSGIHGALGLGEGDDVAYVVAVGEHHQQPVYAGGDATVRGRAVLQGVQQLAEALRYLLPGIAERAEHALLQLPVVYADAAAGELRAVANEVVYPRRHLPGVSSRCTAPALAWAC